MRDMMLSQRIAAQVCHALVCESPLRQHARVQVKELQFRGMLASSLQYSVASTGNANPASTGATSDMVQVDADSVAKTGHADAAAQGTEGTASEEDGATLGKLSAEIDHLRKERGELFVRLGNAEQHLAEARKVIEQKEGHLQGLQASGAPVLHAVFIRLLAHISCYLLPQDHLQFLCKL